MKVRFPRPWRKRSWRWLLQQGGSPRRLVVRELGLEQVADEGALERIVDQIIAGHPGEVSRFRAGNTKLIGFFVGEVIKASGGKKRTPQPGRWRC